jgi:hypothetical protein
VITATDCRINLVGPNTLPGRRSGLRNHRASSRREWQGHTPKSVWPLFSYQNRP